LPVGPAWLLLRRLSQAATSLISVSLSGIRRSRHCPDKTLSSVSAIFSQNNWLLINSSRFLRGTALAGTLPGQPGLITIGSDLVITGKIHRRSTPIDVRNHQVTLSGRGITRNLIGSTVDLLNDPGIRGGQINGANALDEAAKLCKAYGITARSAVADLGMAILSFQVLPGETPYQIIESVARCAGYLVSENLLGRRNFIANWRHPGFAGRLPRNRRHVP